jgi:hypothetical protein
MVLVKEGKLTLPLFHGTSSLFVKSIFKNGLGGENPIQELRVIPFLQNLCEACQRTLSGDPRWLSEKWLVDQMLSQQNPNFRHGGSFLSPSRLTAVRYAASNPFGSEVISIAAQLYKLLTEFEPRHKLDLRVTEFPIIAVLNKTPNPVLVEVSHVNISYLQGEQGQTAQQIIRACQTDLKRRHRTFECYRPAK